MDILTNLPRDIALDCLIRLPFNQLHNFTSFCNIPELLRLRKAAGKAQSLLILSQNKVAPTQTLDTDWVDHLVVFDPETSCWSEMPPLPESNKLPLFFKMVVVGSDLVVMGGQDPETRQCLDSVFIFNFISCKWRRGANMPNGPRSSFGCVADCDGKIFVYVGKDVERNALKSTWMYDVATNNWTQLADMAKEFFDTSTRQWVENNNMVSKTIQILNICVEGVDDRKLYKCHGNDLFVLEDGKWKGVARLPHEVTNQPSLIAYPGHLFVTGATNESLYGEPHNAFILDLKKIVWKKVQVPMECSGQVRSGCCLVI